MNYQSLIYFKTVAELQHFTKAAEELYITQPALSKAIHHLEQELGCPLFQKEGRNVVLTSYGECFYEYINRSVEEINAGVEAIRRMAAANDKAIHLEALYSVHSTFLPNCIYHFRQEHPDVHISMEHKYTSAVLRDLINGKCNLGICSNFAPVGEFRNLDRTLLFKEKLCLIVDKRHPFAQRSSVAPEELKEQAFIVYSQSKNGINQVLLSLCKTYGFQPKIQAEGFNDYGVFGMVAASEGIAIVPESDAFKNDNVVQLEIKSSIPLFRDIYLVWRKGERLSPQIEAFRNRLMEAAKSY